MNSTVQLGFCIPIASDEQRLLVGHRSKQYLDWDGGQAGGKPTWLDPTTVPNTPPLCCTAKRMRFVCQVYAPRDEDEHNYHRTLYVWGCENCNRVVVWRCQLPEDNPFWSGADVDDREGEMTQRWCAACNFPAKGTCPKQGVPFCGKEHQRSFLKHRSSGTTYQEHEIVVENEADQALSTEEKDTPVIIEDIQDDPDSDAEIEQEDLNEALTGRRQERLTTPEDEAAWNAFQDKIQRAKDQVLRYGDSEPLWVRSPPSSLIIPPCELCGAARTFEFQLLPQLLQYLQTKTTPEDQSQSDSGGSLVAAISAADDFIQQVPSEMIPPELVDKKDAAIKRIISSGLDWGTVAIYTCSKSCQISSYVNEHAHVQGVAPNKANDDDGNR